MLNKKILLAPILAISLVLSIAAAVTYLPAGPQASPLSRSSPEPSPAVYFNVTTPAPSPSPGSYNMATHTPIPTSMPAATAAPTTTPATGLATAKSNYLPILPIIAALVIGVVIALLFFSEKSLKKDLGRGFESNGCSATVRLLLKL